MGLFAAANALHGCDALAVNGMEVPQARVDRDRIAHGPVFFLAGQGHGASTATALAASNFGPSKPCTHMMKNMRNVPQIGVEREA